MQKFEGKKLRGLTMRVNGINSFYNLNFKRAIQIESDTNYGRDDGQIDNATMDVIKVMQNKPTSYNTGISKKINTFLRAQIGDISKSRVYPRKIKGKIYIFTGEEAKAARQIDLEAKKKMETLAQDGKKIAAADRDLKFLELVEDGKTDACGREKPATQITLNMAKSGRLKSIEYFSLQPDDTEEDGVKITENKLVL